MKESYNYDLRMSSDDVRFSVDWLRGYTFTTDVARFFDGLGKIDERLKFKYWSPWRSGSNFYSTRWCLNNDGMFQVCWNIEYDEDKSKNYSVLNYPSDDFNDFVFPEGYFTARDIKEANGGIYVQISGVGLRYLGNDTFLKILDFLQNNAFNCTRIDFACDIFNKENTIVPLLCEAAENMVMCNYDNNSPRLKGNFQLQTLKYYRNVGANHINFSVGMSSAKYMFRLYDKKNQVLSGKQKAFSDDMLPGKDINEIDYWTRLEYQCNCNEGNAQAYFLSLVKDKCPISSLFALCFKSFFQVAYIKSIEYRNYKVRGSDEVKVQELFHYSEEDALYHEFYEYINTKSLFIQKIVYLKYSTREKFLKQVRRLCGFLYKCLNDPGALDIVLKYGRIKFDSDKSEEMYKRELRRVLIKLEAG